MLDRNMQNDVSGM